MKLRSLSAALLFAASPVFAAPVEYTIDPGHTQVEFSYSHFGFSTITGRFDQVSGKIVYDAANPSASSVEATLVADSIDTGVDKLDAHLKSGDLFDSAKFPVATFKSNKVEAAGEGRLKVTGDVSIHGVTKSIILDVTINKIADHPMKKVPTAGFDARTVLLRSEFGMDMAVPNVSDEVRIDITTEALGTPAG